MDHLWAPWRMKFILNANTESEKSSSLCVFCELPKNANDQESLILKKAQHCFVILNKFPYNPSHLMVIPYQHTASLDSLSEEALLEIHQEIRNAVAALKSAISPAGFNVGMNLGEAGGAGIREHLHYHVVPRWNGDTNFMPILGGTKILPESLEDTLNRLKPFFT